MFSVHTRPVWIKDRETERHLRAQFKTVLPMKSGATYTARIATSGIYHLTVNGVFVAYGPARAGKNHFRMDELDITRFLQDGNNAVVIEVCGYNVNSYCLQSQPSFLQAELLCDGTAVAYTGRDFVCRVNPYALRKTQRYSFQRPMVEAYRITDAQDAFFTDVDTAGASEPLAVTAPKTILPRTAPYPLFERTAAQPIVGGSITHAEPETYKQDRSWKNVGGQFLGFSIPELEVFATQECQRLQFHADEEWTGDALPCDRFQQYTLPYNATGMVTMEVSCAQPVTLYVMFDELRLSGTVDYLRMDCANAVRYDLCAGEHRLQFFEVYTMKYLQLAALDGDCTVREVGMVEYKHPPVAATLPPVNRNLQKIYTAAVETFRQNAVDIFMDCPSRERAGWLCDSFFHGRTEFCLTGANVIEKAFLENFLHEDVYAFLPDGMLPMCYPADHNDGNFIPNWAMWLVLELQEYHMRTGDVELVSRFRDKVYALLRYFSGFENADGLLEGLKGWVFVEWSRANELVQDVNYPSNMLYRKLLVAAGELYSDAALLDKAERVRQTVLAQSYNGVFFTDNAVRKDGVLVSSGEITVVCQYYAFFCGIATPQTHPTLFETLVCDFGPQRKETGAYPEVHFSAPFIGNYLRLDILMQNGYKREVLDNIEGYFLYMAEQTGTLWEMAQASASCNHGFAAYVLYWIMQA